MLKLTVASIKMLFRDKQALFWALAFPVIFVVVFGLFDFDSPPETRVALVGEQGVGARARPGAPDIAATLSRALDEVESFDVSRSGDLAAARDRLRDDQLDVVLAVDDAAGKVTVLYDQASAQENQTAISVVAQVVDRMNLRMAGVESPAIALVRRGVEAKDVSYFDFLLPGFVAMGVMNASIIGMAVAVAQFRHQRILKRILATPLSPVRFLSAQVAARLVLAMVQTALIVATGVFVFGGRLYGNPLWLFALAAVANLIFLNIGFAVAGRSPNPDAAQGIANAVAIPMMFFSGVFFPTETLPDVMQTVVRFLPLTPLIDAMRTVTIDGAPITEAGPELAMLAAWVAGSFLLATRLFRFGRT